MSLKNKIRGLLEVWAFDNRLSLIFTKTLFPQENLQVYRFQGLDILTDRAGGDANGAREVLTSSMYRSFIPKMELSGTVNVLDLGANNGGFPLLLKTNGIELKKVVCVEFNPRTFTRLYFNLMHNLSCEVIPLNLALCGEERLIEISLGGGSVSDSIYAESDNSDARVYKIRGFTFDWFCDAYFDNEVIDICKIDVEGAEFEVFLQPAHQNLRQCRYLIMEIHEREGRLAAEILPEIAKLGFVRQPTDPGADPTVHFFINSKFEGVGIGS